MPPQPVSYRTGIATAHGGVLEARAAVRAGFEPAGQNSGASLSQTIDTAQQSQLG
jgi:hypothetical protein